MLIMETRGTLINLSLDLNDELYKNSFFTAGELLDIYLLKEGKVSYIMMANLDIRNLSVNIYLRLLL